MKMLKQQLTPTATRISDWHYRVCESDCLNISEQNTDFTFSFTVGGKTLTKSIETHSGFYFSLINSDVVLLTHI